MKQKKTWGLKRSVDQVYYKNNRNLEKKDGVWDELYIRIEQGNKMIIQRKKMGVEAKCRLGLL